MIRLLCVGLVGLLITLAEARRLPRPDYDAVRRLQYDAPRFAERNRDRDAGPYRNRDRDAESYRNRDRDAFRDMYDTVDSDESYWYDADSESDESSGWGAWGDDEDIRQDFDDNLIPVMPRQDGRYDYQQPNFYDYDRSRDQPRGRGRGRNEPDFYDYGMEPDMRNEIRDNDKIAELTRRMTEMQQEMQNMEEMIAEKQYYGRRGRN